MPKVSIIVPVYNTAKYLPCCIDSILNQTFSDFELILVNDGSTDNSGKICNDYAQKDNRIILIHKDNCGANKARETGVNASCGQWITFVDSDDTINSNYIETLYSNISYDIDIVIAKLDKSHDDFHGIITSDAYRKLLIRGRFPSPVCKLYTSKLFSHNVFKIPQKIKVGEDLIMNIKLAFNTDANIKIIDNILYSYNTYQESTYHSHIATLNYDDVFFRELLHAIPGKYLDQYNEDIFYYVYNLWTNHCGYRYSVNQEWRDTRLNDFLINNYKNNIAILNKFDYNLIGTKKTYIRFILIILKKIINQFNFIHK